MLREAIWFSEHGHNVCIATPGDGELFKRASRAGLLTYAVRMRNSTHLPSLCTLLRLIKRHYVDLIYSHSGKDSWLGGISGFFTGVPLVRSRELFNTIKHKSAYNLFPKRVLACSEAVKRHMVASGVNESKVFVQYPPVDIDKIQLVSAVEINTVRNELRLDGRSPVIVHVGEFRKEKRQSDLIGAMKKVLEVFPSSLLLLVGQGYRMASARALVAEAGIGEHVLFLGEREDVPAILANADIFAFPSDVEPFGMAPVEAMAAGLPVVSTNVGGLAEIVTHEVNGLQVPPCNPDALAAAILRMLREPGLRERLASAGREGARYFDARQSMPRLLNHFQEVIAQKG